MEVRTAMDHLLNCPQSGERGCNWDMGKGMTWYFHIYSPHQNHREYLRAYRSCDSCHTRFQKIDKAKSTNPLKVCQIPAIFPQKNLIRRMFSNHFNAI